MLLILTCASAALGAYRQPPGNVLGGLSAHTRNDSIFVDFAIEVSGFPPDTVSVTLSGGGDTVVQYIVYSRFAAVNAAVVTSRVDSGSGPFRLRGRIHDELIGESAPRFADVFAVGRIDTSRVSSGGWVPLRPKTASVYLNLLGWGWEWGTAPDDVSRSEFFGNFEIGAAYHLNKSQFSYLLSTGGNLFDQDGAFTFAEPVDFRFTHYPLGRSGWRPSFLLGVKYARQCISDGSRSYRRTGWGPEIGANLEGDFERFGYNYTTAIGGYHTFSAMFAYRSGMLVRTGTRYDLVVTDRATTFRVQLQIEGMGYAVGAGETLLRPHTRPWWHWALSQGAAVPYLPIIGIVELVKLIK